MNNLYTYIPKKISNKFINNKYIFKEYNEKLMYSPKDIDYNKAVQLLIAQKYSLEDEIALKRQEFTKPDEYKIYYDYCEECKLKAREFIVIKENWNN